MPPELHASMSTRLSAHSDLHTLHAFASRRPTSRLQSSVPPRRYACSARLYLHTCMLMTACLQISSPSGSITLHLRVATHTARFQGSMPAFLPVATPTARPYTSRPPYLHIARPATRLQTSRRPRPYGCSARPEVQSSIFPYLHIATPVANVQSSIPLFVHVATTTVRLRFPRLQAPYLYASMSLHIQHASRAPCLQSSTSLHLS